jgi:hypothetical protein
VALPTLVNILTIKQKTRLDSRRSPGTAEALRAFFKHMESKANPDLYLEYITGLESAPQVISDAACKLYVIFIHKPAASTTNSWFKAKDHATLATDANGASAFGVPLVGTGGGNREYAIVFPDGVPLGTGLTIGQYTTLTGNTECAAADAVTGFVIIGAP